MERLRADAIERGWRHDLGGTAALDFRPGGVACVLEAPARLALTPA